MIFLSYLTDLSYFPLERIAASQLSTQYLGVRAEDG
jgi:hypothetical protein